MDAHADLVEQEADRVTNKARKIGTTLRKIVRASRMWMADPADPGVLAKSSGLPTRRCAGSVPFAERVEGRYRLGLPTSTVSSASNDVGARNLEPKTAVAMDGSLRRLAGYVNLELQTPKEERFHRVYKGSHPARQDRVVLHLYDLSASDEKNAEAKARREFEALHRLQLHLGTSHSGFLSRRPGYAGEMFFFTVVDPAAPASRSERPTTTWDTTSRLAFARGAVCALAELHQAGTGDEPMVHRNLTPSTILVKHDNSPILTGFDRTKIPSDISVASSGAPTRGWDATALQKFALA